MFRKSLLALLLALPFSAGALTSEFLFLSYSGGDGSYGEVDNSISGFVPGLSTSTFTSAGWIGSADFTTNIIGGSLSFPLSLNLTTANLTCADTDGCSSLDLSFFATFDFASMPPELDGAAPFSVSVTGSGPAGEFEYGIGTNEGYGVQVNYIPFSSGTYSYSNPGFLSSESGAGSNLLVIGDIEVSGGQFGDTFSLPDGFDFQVGSSDTSGAPEPGTWLLTSGAFAIAFARRVWRRRVR